MSDPAPSSALPPELIGPEYSLCFNEWGGLSYSAQVFYATDKNQRIGRPHWEAQP